MKCLANASQWSFMAKVDALKTRPLLVVTSDDAYAGETRHSQAHCAGQETAAWRRYICLPTTLIPISAAHFRVQFSLACYRGLAPGTH